MPLPTTTISSRGSVRFVQAVRDLVEYRELFTAFVARDIKVRYKQTALGVVWVILQPLATGVIFALLFGIVSGRFGGWESVLFFLAGLVPWTAFHSGVLLASSSMEANANLVTKVYFPRMVIPGAHVAGAMLDFLIGFAVLVAVAGIVGKASVMLLLIMPALALLQLAFAMGLSLVLAALNAQYRDIKYAVPFLLQTAMFLTVFVPLESWRGGANAANVLNAPLRELLYQLLSLNPLAAVIETYRAVLQGQPLDAVLLLKGTLVAVAMLAGGITFFNARERRLVDVL